MFEGFTYTDWLLICVLWFQVANLLFQLWPKLMRLRFHGKAETKGKADDQDAYETFLGGEKKE